MTYQVICAWCGQSLGVKHDDEPEDTQPATTHSICPDCKQKALAELNLPNKEGKES